MRDQANLIDDIDVWERVRDIVVATGFGERSGVMVHSMHDLTQTGWFRLTGDELLIGRVRGVLQGRHAAYHAVENCPGTADIGWFMSLGGIVFEEEA